MDRVKKYLRSPPLLWAVYTLLAILTAVQRMSMGIDANGDTRYENYRIFKYSWHYFISGGNPYASNPETWDLYKYSPAFSVFMAPFYAFPDAIGFPLWNLLNALPLLAVLLALPGISQHRKALLAWFILPELIICLQNAQSNGLTAALMIAVFLGLYRRKTFQAALWISAGAFLKLFGIFAGILVLFYPKQWGKSLLYFIGISLFLAFAPALFIGWAPLKQVYIWWLEMLRNDHAASIGVSVAGWLESWWGYLPDKGRLAATGLVIQVLAAGWMAYQRKSPLAVLAALLIWVVIFNHKAESPTFVIAMCGAGIWFFSLRKPGLPDKILLAACFVLSSLTPTDLFPKTWYHDVVQPYQLKAIPFIVLWIWLIINSLIQYEQRTDLEIY